MDHQGNKGNRGNMGTEYKPKAGYEYLLAYKITVPIYDYTVELSRRCKSPDYPDFPNLPSTRSHDQIVQAARSGMSNIVEGKKQQSLKGYIYLSGIARGSLDELLKDFHTYARQNKIPIWSPDRCKREIREIRVIWEIIRKTPTLPDSPNFPNLPYEKDIAINMLITLTKQANYLLDKLILSLHEKHKKTGGLTEKLYKERKSYRGY